MFTLFRMKLNNQDEKNNKKTVRAPKPGLRNKITASIKLTLWEWAAVKDRR